jgi:hypothetical protein
MAQKEGKCGTATISYDENCSWVCMCAPRQPCVWSVTCPKNGGETTTSGEGRTIQVTVPTLTIDGNLKAVAAFLSKTWGRPVSVPPNLATQRVQRTVSGSQEQITVDLGIHLGPKK